MGAAPFSEVLDFISRISAFKEIVAHPEAVLTASCVAAIVGFYVGKRFGGNIWVRRIAYAAVFLVLLVIFFFNTGWFDTKLTIDASFVSKTPCLQTPQERGDSLWRISMCLHSRADFQSVQPVLTRVSRLQDGVWVLVAPGLSTNLDLGKGKDIPFGPDQIRTGDDRFVVLFHYDRNARSLSLFDDKTKREWDAMHNISPGKYKLDITLVTTPKIPRPNYTVVLDWFGNLNNFSLEVSQGAKD